jgi:hypothetical protein
MSTPKAEAMRLGSVSSRLCHGSLGEQELAKDLDVPRRWQWLVVRPVGLYSL